MYALRPGVRAYWLGPDGRLLPATHSHEYTASIIAQKEGDVQPESGSFSNSLLEKGWARIVFDGKNLYANAKRRYTRDQRDWLIANLMDGYNVYWNERPLDESQVKVVREMKDALPRVAGVPISWNQLDRENRVLKKTVDPEKREKLYFALWRKQIKRGAKLKQYGIGRDELSGERGREMPKNLGRTAESLAFDLLKEDDDEIDQLSRQNPEEPFLSSEQEESGKKYLNGYESGFEAALGVYESGGDANDYDVPGKDENFNAGYEHGWRTFWQERFSDSEPALESLLNEIAPVEAPGARIRQSKQFKVASVSSNANSFGLHGVILVAQNGEAWEVGITGQFAPAKGDVLVLKKRLDGRDDWDFAEAGMEIPRSLGTAPPKVVSEIWS